VSPERLVRWAPRLFAGIGAVLIVVAAVMAVFTARFVATAERTEGTVIDLSRSEDSEGSVTYSPVVRFTADGRTIQFTSSSGSSSPPSVGDRVEVLYDPDDPDDARLSGFLDLWLFPLVAGAIGIACGAIGGFIAWRTRRPSKEDVEWLRRHGRRAEGASPRVVHCTDIDVVGSSPFRLDVDVHDRLTNKVRVLRSEYIWFDPGPYLTDRQTLDVYLDPEDPERYLVDTSFLPESESESVRLAP
jgi:Protein of unknown function (DUF3592)